MKLADLQPGCSEIPSWTYGNRQAHFDLHIVYADARVN